jgi:Ca2+-binding EF-hand superfamily protein
VLWQDEHGLRFEGLKAALNELGAKMEECDMREIFFESDMVRDDTLTHSEFVVSLAIAFLLGLISNFECILRTLPPPVETTAVGGASEGRSSAASARADASAKISKTLELIVTAYLLFDEDASGTIQIGEVRKVMQKHNESSSRRTLERKSSGMTTKAIRAARIEEMDLNSDGTITFQEFVLTFQKWVGIDEV